MLSCNLMFGVIKMNLSELKAIILRGEDSRHQFKEDIRNGDSLAAEIVAFSNSRIY